MYLKNKVQNLVVYCGEKTTHYFNQHNKRRYIMTQMRVKDQDLIIEQVVEKIEATELEKFKARDDVQSIQGVIETRIEHISGLLNQYKELEETIKADQKELEALVKSFQEANGFETGLYYDKQGIELQVAHYGVGVPEYKIVWNLPNSTKRELSTKLRLQTMGGDFDVYKLIEELTTEFSS